jgi:hypothetical protein
VAPPRAAPGQDGPAQVVDSKYMADFHALNAAEEAAGQRGAVNTNFKKGPEGPAEKVKTKDPLLSQVSLDEERKRDRRRRPDQDPEQAEAQDAAESAAQKLGLADSKHRLFEEEQADRMGDPELSDPREMRRILGPSARFAQHAMLLAEKLRSEGKTRQEALQYLASLYLNCGDAAYANKALREFGPATGIVDLYPLELVDHLLEAHPGFLNKTSRGSFFVKAPRVVSGVVGQPIRLEYPEELKMRGFAVKGGGVIGYRYEPVDPPGTHLLTFDSAGTFELLVSALAKDRSIVVDTLRAEIAEASG